MHRELETEELSDDDDDVEEDEDDDERARLANVADRKGRTALHRGARTGHLESVQTILKCLQVLDDPRRLAVMHDEAGSDRKSLWSSGDPIKLVLPLSQPEILQYVDKRDANEQTALHHAAISQNMECLKLLLTCYPESERLQVVNMEDRNGNTILSFLGGRTLDSIMPLLPELDRESLKRPKPTSVNVEYIT